MAKVEKPRRKEFTIEGAELVFLNFSGREDKYNQEGQRHFSVVLTEEIADKLSAEGWNVKLTKPKNDAYDPIFYIPVAARFDIRPPQVVMISNFGKTRTLLDEDTIGVLDIMDIATVDLICSGNEFTVQGKSGIKAYLKKMFVTINEDDLDRKYAINNED